MIIIITLGQTMEYLLPRKYAAKNDLSGQSMMPFLKCLLETKTIRKKTRTFCVMTDGTRVVNKYIERES
jgi:hypothetical protein